MADVALGVRNSGADGTTPLALRRILAALFPHAGVVGGLAVSGGPALAYSVAAGVAVCSKGLGRRVDPRRGPGGEHANGRVEPARGSRASTPCG
jgi:hypothetical protein